MLRARVPLLAQPCLSRPYKQSKHSPVPRAGRVLGGCQTFQWVGAAPRQAVCALSESFSHFSPPRCLGGCSGVSRRALVHSEPSHGTVRMKLFSFPSRDQSRHSLCLQGGLSAFISHLLIYCDTEMKPRMRQVFREKRKLQPLPRPPTLLLAQGTGPASGSDELQVMSPGWGGTGGTAPHPPEPVSVPTCTYCICEIKLPPANTTKPPRGQPPVCCRSLPRVR